MFEHETIFEIVGEFWVILFFLIFSKNFFFTAFLSRNIETFSKDNENKTCVNKPFDIMITKYYYVFY